VQDDAGLIGGQTHEVVTKVWRCCQRSGDNLDQFRGRMRYWYGQTLIFEVFKVQFDRVVYEFHDLGATACNGNAARQIGNVSAEA